jgi:hypothetical protein
VAEVVEGADGSGDAGAVESGPKVDAGSPEGGEAITL